MALTIITHYWNVRWFVCVQIMCDSLQCAWRHRLRAYLSNFIPIDTLHSEGIEHTLMAMKHKTFKMISFPTVMADAYVCLRKKVFLYLHVNQGFHEYFAQTNNMHLVYVVLKWGDELSWKKCRPQAQSPRSWKRPLICLVGMKYIVVVVLNFLKYMW